MPSLPSDLVQHAAIYNWPIADMAGRCGHLGLVSRFPKAINVRHENSILHLHEPLPSIPPSAEGRNVEASDGNHWMG